VRGFRGDRHPRPAPPTRMLRQPVRPQHIELGVSGSSAPPYAAAVVLRAPRVNRAGRAARNRREGEGTPTSLGLRAAFGAARSASDTIPMRRLSWFTTGR